jgi:hypothetical protein
VWPKSDLLTVSDFWVRQSLAYGQLRLSEAQLQRLSAAVSRWTENEVPPRLLVLLETSTEAHRWRATRRDLQLGPTFSAEELMRLQQGLRGLVERPGQGPVLCLDARETSRAVSDVMAALAAMA